MLDILSENFFNTDFLALDLETTAMYNKLPDPHRDKVVLFGLSNGREHFVVEPGYWLKDLWEWMADSKHTLIGHNLKFDLKFLWNLGCPVRRPILWDTLIAERILVAGTLEKCDLGSTAWRRTKTFWKHNLLTLEYQFLDRTPQLSLSYFEFPKEIKPPQYDYSQYPPLSNHLH